MSSYNLPWKIRLLSALIPFGFRSFCSKNCTINRRILKFFDIKISPSQTPRNDVKTSDFIIDSTRNLWFRLYIPTSTAATTTTVPVVIYMHGGGFCLFSPDSIVFDVSCRRLASELNSIIISINYRLAPEFKYPCQYEDCFDALTFIDANFDTVLPFFADPTRCFLLGDSAGGNLIHFTAVKASGYGFLRLKLSGLISVQPFFGGEDRTESETRLAKGPLLTLELTDWFWKAFLPNGSDRNHPSSNVSGPESDDISGLKFPPVLLVIGGLDVLQDWGRKYEEWLKKNGKEVYLVEYPNSIHWFWVFTDLPEYSLLIKEVKNFISWRSNQSAK